MVRSLHRQPDQQSQQLLRVITEMSAMLKDAKHFRPVCSFTACLASHLGIKSCWHAIICETNPGQL